MSELEELYFRHNLALFCIRTVSENEIGTPGRAEAIAEYNRQLAEIDAKIAEIEGKPPAITIGLKAATLTAEALGGK